jgi:hypothetical protein
MAMTNPLVIAILSTDTHRIRAPMRNRKLLDPLNVMTVHLCMAISQEAK